MSKLLRPASTLTALVTADDPSELNLTALPSISCPSTAVQDWKQKAGKVISSKQARARAAHGERRRKNV